MSLHIAITGATGFAGRHTVTELQRQGHRLRALVRNPDSAGLKDIELVKGDIASRDALTALVKDVDAIVHLAGALTAFDRQGYFRVNVEGTGALLDAAMAAGTRRFVHVSSLAAREPQLSHYAASKRAAEEAVLRRSGELNAVILRPPAVYGPGDKGTLPLIRELTRPIAAIPGRRDARFSLIHARDLARIIGSSIEGREQGIVEVSDGKYGGYAWPDLIAAASGLRGAPIRAVFLPRVIPSLVALGAEGFARLQGRPGMVNRGKVAELYHPDWVSREGPLALADPIGFEQGFAETVAWYREAGWLPRGPAPDTSPPHSRT